MRASAGRVVRVLGGDVRVGPTRSSSPDDARLSPDATTARSCAPRSTRRSRWPPSSSPAARRRRAAAAARARRGGGGGARCSRPWCCGRPSPVTVHARAPTRAGNDPPTNRQTQGRNRSSARSNRPPHTHRQRGRQRQPPLAAAVGTPRVRREGNARARAPTVEATVPTAIGRSLATVEATVEANDVGLSLTKLASRSTTQMTTPKGGADAFRLVSSMTAPTARGDAHTAGKNTPMSVPAMTKSRHWARHAPRGAIVSVPKRRSLSLSVRYISSVTQMATVETTKCVTGAQAMMRNRSPHGSRSRQSHRAGSSSLSVYDSL